MASLNAGSVFAAKKKLSVPAYRLPKKVREALSIARAYENGIFKIEPGAGMALYDRGYIFEDINYINQDEEKKEGVLLQIMKWMKVMGTQFKVTIANEQRDMEKFMEEVFAPANGESYPAMQDGIGKWIADKVRQGTRDVNKIMYLTVTCRAKNLEEAEIYFQNLDTVLNMLFGGFGSRLYRMSGRERLLVLQKLFAIGKEQAAYGGPLGEGTEAWKNHILPASIRHHKQYLEMDGAYASVLFARAYETSLDEGKTLHDLANMPFPLYVTVDCEPIQKDILTGKLQAAHMNNEKAISQELEQRQRNGQSMAGISYWKMRKREELEQAMDQVDDNDEAALFIGLLVLVTARSREQLRKRIDSVKNAAAANGILLDIYNYRQLKALNTALPIGGRQVNHMRSFLTSSAVAFNPYYAHDVQDAGGYVYGLNRTTGRLIIGDRKKLLNPHGIIISHTGGGKSFLIKETEIAQTLLLTDDDLGVLDPQDEFEEIIKSSQGQYFDFTPKCSVHLNPYEIPLEIFQGDAVSKNKFVAVKTDYAASFCTAVMTNIVVTQEHLAVISRAVRRVYEKTFTARALRQPTLKDIYHAIEGQREEVHTEEEKRMVAQITNSLEEYVTGVYDMFAYESNLDIHSRLFGFGLKNVPESIWEPVMVTVMHFLAQRVEHNQGGMVATHLVVDETQVLCARESSARELLHTIETYRKFGGIVTMSIQNLQRALENPDLRDMFSNCSYKCFLDQGGVDALSLAKIQELSGAEFRSLDEDIPGQGILVWGKKILLFDAVMGKENPLYDQFSTNFHEKAGQKGGAF